MRKRRLFGLIIAAALSGGRCLANDSSSELAAGGLVLTKTDAITMQREDLTLTPQQVLVRYEMRNDKPQPVTLRVAFPMPDLPIDTFAGMDLLDASGESNAHNISMPTNLPDFLAFQVKADGTRIEPSVEVKAELADGRNIVEALRLIGGWWLVLHPRMYVSGPNTLSDGDADRDIGPNMLRQLRDLGAITGSDGVFIPLWRTRITFHWMQTFKPGITIVEHRYRPILGGFLMGSEKDKLQGSAGGGPDDPRVGFCIDPAKSRGLLDLTRVGRGAYLSARTLGYIVTTGANWAGPIGTFHLTVDAQATQSADAGVRVISLCTQFPLKQTGPLRLEGTAHEFVPTQDLHVLMVAK